MTAAVRSLAAGRSAPAVWSSLLRTTGAVWPTLLRVTLGAVMLPHGLQKTAGWFGGFGFGPTMAFFTQKAGLPAPVALAVILAESLGAVALIAGAGTRIAAASIGAVMIGAIATTHAAHGFFMNWFGAQQGEGFEYHLLVLGIVGALLVGGGGRASVDRALTSARGADSDPSA